jgi:hypothetical protein
MRIFSGRRVLFLFLDMDKHNMAKLGWLRSKLYNEKRLATEPGIEMSRGYRLA